MDGRLKSLCSFWAALALNHRYSTLFQKRDLKTLHERVEHEGITFLTVVLPRIGKALDRFHATTVWDAPEGFECKLETFDNPHCSELPCDYHFIPLFMRKAIKLAVSGKSPLAVDYVRQMSYVFYKLEVPYDQKTLGDFLEGFKITDQEVGCVFANEDPQRDRLLATARGLVARVLNNVDPRDIRPSHGKGSTACRTKDHEKYHKLRYYRKLDDYFSYSEYFFFSSSHLIDELGKLESSEERDPMARVVFVPKDSRGPRVISCEPAELLFIQQGLMNLLYETIENHHLTRGRVNFASQEVNRDLARQSSIDGVYATLDLSEASDRVSLELVRRIFPTNWFEALDACRSEETLLPDGTVMRMHKFAPMGSSCCFPVEALCFWALVQAKMIHLRCESECFIYGDDIIVEASHSSSIMEAIESVGLKVNREKSFCYGPFRESCGGEYYQGVDVTPIRVRNFLSKSHTSVLTGADLCNEIIAKFGYLDSRLLIQEIECALEYAYPRSEMQLPCCILTDPSASNDVFFKRRFSRRLQRFEHRVLQPSVTIKQLQPPNWGELFRKELARGRQSNAAWEDESEDRFLRNVRTLLQPGEYADRHSVRSKWQWTWLG